MTKLNMKQRYWTVEGTTAELQEQDHFILNSVWHLQKLLKNSLNRSFLNTAADQHKYKRHKRINVKCRTWASPTVMQPGEPGPSVSGFPLRCCLCFM